MDTPVIPLSELRRIEETPFGQRIGQYVVNTYFPHDDSEGITRLFYATNVDAWRMLEKFVIIDKSK